MAAAYLVIYEGRPDDPEEFVRYYRDVHLPLVWEFPGLRQVELHISAEDDSEVFMVTRLSFDDEDALREGVNSPARERTRADMETNILPRFEGTVRHVITTVHPLFR